MGKRIRIVGERRKEIDEDKLALAFLLLARTIHAERSESEAATDDAPEVR